MVTLTQYEPQELAERVFPPEKMDMRQRNTQNWYKNTKSVSGKIRPSLKTAMNLIPKHGSILDVGCGKGYCYDWMQGKRSDLFSYTGIDINIDEIADAVATHGDAPRYMRMDMYDLGQWNYEKFDVVMCNRVMVHNFDMHRAMEAMWGVTKTALVICNHVSLKPFDRKPIAIEHSNKTWAYVRKFTKEMYYEYAEELGASVEIIPTTNTQLIGVFTYAQTS